MKLSAIAKQYGMVNVDRDNGMGVSPPTLAPTTPAAYTADEARHDMVEGRRMLGAYFWKILGQVRDHARMGQMMLLVNLPPDPRIDYTYMERAKEVFRGLGYDIETALMPSPHMMIAWAEPEDPPHLMGDTEVARPPEYRQGAAEANGKGGTIIQGDNPEQLAKDAIKEADRLADDGNPNVKE